jgi:hypothetical protein
MRLYEIPDAIRAAIEGDVDPVTGEILSEDMEAKLEALEEEFERKAEWIALLAREAKAEAEAVGLEERRLAARRKAAENREGRLKAYLLLCMENAHKDRVEGPRAKIRLQNNPPAIRWALDADAIPEEYRRVTVAPDLAKARDQYKDGQSLPEGFTVEIGKHVRIS